MKFLPFIVFLFCFFSQSTSLYADEIVVMGTYQGKNIYVQNPFTSDQTRYCTESVYLNNALILSKPRSSSYEINLSSLALNAAIEIKIVYTAGCKPKIINPYAIKSNTNFKFVNFTVDDKSLYWNTENETANSVYYIESFVNNNWSTLKVLSTQQVKASNSYSLVVSHTTGQNRYRIKHQEKSGQISYSPTILFNSNQGLVKFYPRNASSKIYFTAIVNYEISDIYKKVLRKGKGKDVDISTLARGVYYLNFEGRTEQFLKK